MQNDSASFAPSIPLLEISVHVDGFNKSLDRHYMWYVFNESSRDRLYIWEVLNEFSGHEAITKVLINLKCFIRSYVLVFPNNFVPCLVHLSRNLCFFL